MFRRPCIETNRVVPSIWQQTRIRSWFSLNGFITYYTVQLTATVIFTPSLLSFLKSFQSSEFSKIFNWVIRRFFLVWDEILQGLNENFVLFLSHFYMKWINFSFLYSSKLSSVHYQILSVSMNNSTNYSINNSKLFYDFDDNDKKFTTVRWIHLHFMVIKQ